MKIRVKLTAFFAVIFFILALILSAWYQYRLFYVLNQESIKNLDMFSGSFFKQRRDINEIEDIERLKKRLNNFQNRDEFSKMMSNHTWFALYDDNFDMIEGTKFANSFKIESIERFRDKGYFNITIKTNPQYFLNNKLTLSDDFKPMFSHIFYSENDNYTFPCIGKMINISSGNKKYYFVILLPENKNKEYLNKSLINVIISLFFLISIIIVMGLIYSKYALNPINRIINQLNTISEQDLSQRVNSQTMSKDEIAEITTSINNLLERIENAFNMEKQFISDVSHEFKTPIAILQLNIENISSNPSLTDDEIDKITSSLEILYSLDFLIKKLLYLSRLEANLCTFNPQIISLKDLLTSVVNNLQNIAVSKNLYLNLEDRDNNIKIRGDKDLLYIAFSNIIENGLKYTDKGGITIKCADYDKMTAVEIEDTGIGIPKEKINKIFDKFYRVDRSRHDSKSFGIGLTITKRILDIHKSRIKVESIQKKGSVFVITFPKTTA